MASKIFEASILSKFFRSNFNKFRDSLMLTNPKLKQNDPILINELSNSLSYRMGNSFRNLSDLEVLKRKATDLIALIQKEYHLE